MFEAFIFDFDGVIVDSEPYRLETYRQLFLEEYGVSLEFNVKDIIGQQQRENLSLFLQKYPEITDSLEEVISKRQKFLKAIPYHKVPFFYGIARLVGEIQFRGLSLAVASNSSEVYIKKYEPFAPFKMTMPIIAAGQKRKPKPAPDIYIEASSLLHKEPSVCLAFEDSPVGIQAAKAAGMKVVGVTSTFNETELLGADGYIAPDQMIPFQQIENLYER